MYLCPYTEQQRGGRRPAVCLNFGPEIQTFLVWFELILLSKSYFLTLTFD